MVSCEVSMINLCLHLEDLTTKLQSWCHFCKHARCLYSPPLLQIAMPIMGQPCQLLWFEETQNGILGNQPNNKLFCRDTVNVSISEITFGLASLTWVQCHSFKGFPDCIFNMQRTSLHCPLEQLKVLVKVLIQQNVPLWYFWVKEWRYLSSLFATDFLVSKTLVPSCWIQYFVRHSYVPIL